MINENVPLFEEYFGQLDYDWLLRATKRKCFMITPCVIRYEDGNNLSLDNEYRKRDFYMVLLVLDGDLKAMKKVYGTRGRYYYKIGNTKLARFWLRQANLHWKTVLYYLTSYIPFLRLWINRNFRVFG